MGGSQTSLPWTRSPLLRFLVQTILIVASTMLLIFFQGQIYKLIFNDMPLTQQELLETWQFFVAIIIVSLFVSAVHTGHYLLNRWKASISEAKNLQLKAMEMKEIAMQSELQSLKMQLDPHFMFNNFSTLSELINEDRETAIRFLENLSRVYRYMIQNLKKDIVLLSDEVAFVKAYCYLIHIRHADNVQVLFDLDEESLNLYIPPISLQLLVENAIKHNIATKEQPLIITIISNDRREIIVCNNLQRISSAFPATGIGLKNIIDRYRILSEEQLPVIEETTAHFCVTLHYSIIHYAMQILIIEDEKHNASRLQRLLADISAEFVVVGVLETVKESINWLKKENAPDVILMDIRLSDGLSFDIFDKVDVICPVIFTTSYDEYAVRAFKVNSIDYLLKPIEKEELEAALEKVDIERKKEPTRLGIRAIAASFQRKVACFS